MLPKTMLHILLNIIKLVVDNYKKCKNVSYAINFAFKCYGMNKT